MLFPKWTVWSAFVAVAALGVWASTQQPSAQQRSPASTDNGTSPVGKDQANYPLSPNEKGGMDETGPYEVVPDHFKPSFPEGWTWAAVEGIYAESPNRVYVFQRGILPALVEGTGPRLPGFPIDERRLYVNYTGLPVQAATGLGQNVKQRQEYVLTVYDGTGNRIEHWKHLDTLAGAHRIRVNPSDPEKHLWLVGHDKILKVTRDAGKVVMTVETVKAESPSVQGNSFQDLAFLPNGDFFVLEDGRVIRFSKDGKQLMTFGKEGRAPGEIYRAHAITIDGRGRIYVAERPRVQVFDQNGKTLDIWPNIRFGSGAMVLDKNDRVWVADAEIHRIAGYNLNGKLLSHWGVAGADPGRLYGVSQMSVDSQGNLYVAEHYGGRPQMFRPKKGADPNHLIGQLVQ